MEQIHRGQMSESVAVGILLTLAGGFQDAYTYIFRGQVFANAQTGNIILLGKNVAEGAWGNVPHYLIPVIGFITGVFLSQEIQYHFKNSKNLHWRQITLIFEVIILFTVGLLPSDANGNIIANSLVSFSCAMQMDSFRKVKGRAFATTMCVGNLRNATALLCAYKETGDKEAGKKSLESYFLIFIFAVGAVLGNFAALYIGAKAVWFCCAALAAAFLIMFIKEETLLEDAE